MLVLTLLVVVAAIASVGSGAVAIAPGRVLEILWSVLHRDANAVPMRESIILLDIRIPRTLLGFMVGAALAVSGALLQGLFRNPLADPGLAGVSAGAALAAASLIVLGDQVLPPGFDAYVPVLLPAAAFAGGLLSTLVLSRIATRAGRTSVAIMLLAGVALGALASSMIGLLVYLSDDRQLRDLTFWSLGSLGGATWPKVWIEAALVLPVLVVVPFMARALNALSLGEADAYYLGIAVERTKRIMIALVALAVGASAAMAGPIGFIGIVVPHLIRLVAGADHRIVLPASALLGGVLLVSADILARTLAAPAEVPIGILTAAVGAPFFLWLLLTRAREVAG